MTMNNILIVAPHIDDELIGCWSVIARRKFTDFITVLYLYETVDNRCSEALKAAKKFGFNPVFGHLEYIQQDINKALSNNYYQEVYVPSRRDWHADHQCVNREYRRYATKFYSVDMARGVKLADAEAKLAALNKFYPSQKKLWSNNDKYWLFEDICDKDYDEYQTLAWTLSSGFTIEVTVLKHYTNWVLNDWYPSSRLIGGDFDEASINRLLSHCSGRVIVKDKSGIKEAS